MSDTQASGEMTKMDECVRCGEGGDNIRIEDLCFGCWYVERGAEDPDKLIAIVEEVARQRGVYMDERNALVSVYADLGKAMKTAGLKLAGLCATNSDPANQRSKA